MSLLGEIEQWASGEVKNVEHFLDNLEAPVASMVAGLGREIVMEFRDALGFFETQVFEQVKALVTQEVSQLSAKLATDPIGAIAEAAKAVVQQLPQIGVRIGATAVLNMVAAVAQDAMRTSK